MKRILVGLLAIASLVLLLAGCGKEEAKPAADAPIKVGVTAGPHANVMEFVKGEAAKQGLNIEIVEFSDYIQPNIALDQKELNVNSFQHQPFLDNTVKDKGLKIQSIGKTILLPMAIYSNKYKDLKDVPNGATVAIPNDPTNGGRALLLLQQAGLITLKDGGTVKSSVADITSNPKNIDIRELEAAQIARSLNDVDVAAVNTNYAIPAGLNPQKDAVVVESTDSPYANVIAVRTEDVNNETYKKLLSIYQSEPVRKFIQEEFKGSIIPAF